MTSAADKSELWNPEPSVRQRNLFGYFFFFPKIKYERDLV